MSKRKLTRRQQWRIDKIQQERLERQKKKSVAEAVPLEGEEQSGLIVTHFGGQVVVEAADGAHHRCHFRANLEQLVVGDLVLFVLPAGSATGVVTALVPRRTELRRPDPYGNLKPVAANLDLMLVTFAPLPTPSTVLLDRYLVAAELSGIRPVLLLNKADLLDDDTRELLDHFVLLYQSLGYDLLEVSATSREGLAPLRAALAGHTAVFVGQSGVGKSSLVNALIPDAALDVGELSDNSALGQHTTVTARLFHLPEGGNLIDSPGIREFGLWHISEEELLSGFPELAELAGQCRFRNCSHRHEPGCALAAAAEEDDGLAERLDNFFHIADTLDEEGRQRY